jgi:hypothetical protein
MTEIKSRRPAKAEIVIQDTTYVVVADFAPTKGVVFREKGKRKGVALTWADALQLAQMTKH